MGLRRGQRRTARRSVIVICLGVAVFAAVEVTPVRLAEARTPLAGVKTSGTKPSTVNTSPGSSTPSATAASAPSPVGVLHLALSRTGSDGAQRSLPVTVRYPAVGTIPAQDAADALAEPGRYPLVVFVHGYDTSADTYSAIEHDLASAGFVVAAPDFPHTSSNSTADLDESDVVNQAADISFVIDTLTASSAPLIAAHIATAKVGVVGHSDGGVTAAGVADNSCCADSRIGATAILSGAESQFTGSWFPSGSPPLLAVHGTADEVNPFSSSQQLFADASGPKYLVSVANGSHLGPFTTDPVLPEVSTLVADFLHANLGGESAAARRVTVDANAPGLQLVASG